MRQESSGNRRDVGSDIWCLIAITVVNITKRAIHCKPQERKLSFPISLLPYHDTDMDIIHVAINSWFGWRQKHFIRSNLTLYMAMLTICSGMHSLSALEEMASFRLCFILPFSLVPYIPYCLTFYLHSTQCQNELSWYLSNNYFKMESFRNYLQNIQILQSQKFNAAK